MTNLFDNALMTVSPLALIAVWGELVEAYHGVNKFGGVAAEIYAYVVMPYSPMAHTHGREREKVLVAKRAANAFCAIVEEFCDQYECEAQVDGMSLDKWWYRMSRSEVGFDHRCHVKIVRMDNE